MTPTLAAIRIEIYSKVYGESSVTDLKARVRTLTSEMKEISRFSRQFGAYAKERRDLKDYIKALESQDDGS